VVKKECEWRKWKKDNPLAFENIWISSNLLKNRPIT